MIAKFVVLFAVFVAMASTLTTEERFAEFKTKFGKTYATPEEEQERFKVFEANVQRIDEHNKKFETGEVTFSQGVNQFSDLTPDEWKNRNHGLRLKPTST
ncbi:unnamed protein product [Phyllotreta striolata]|uniref:Cathepsin propeptide inhibitor domain-containing protein n=1 Tax=Phyllotreta striolata TaxID=444603 RepID=A0A9N9THQ0_PHYSR|nr:unnamed protein product [Phyllotreta striolata]